MSKLNEPCLCETCYALLSVPLSSVSSSSVVHQNMQRIPLLAVLVDEIVNALWLCKVQWTRNDYVSARALLSAYTPKASGHCNTRFRCACRKQKMRSTRQLRRRRQGMLQYLISCATCLATSTLRQPKITVAPSFASANAVSLHSSQDAPCKTLAGQSQNAA